MKRQWQNCKLSENLCSNCRREVVGSVEAEAARHPGEHVEDNNGRAFGAVNEALEEVGHVGAGRAANGRKHPSSQDDDQVRDVPWAGAEHSRDKLANESIARVGSTQEGAVAESGRVEPPGGGVHQQVQ